MDDLVEQLFIRYDQSLVKKLFSQLLEEDKPYNPKWHPLGFIKMNLYSTSKYSMRLHIWPSGVRRPKKPDWPIHNHVFDLESLVISGSIGSERFNVENSKKSHIEYFPYEVRYTTSGSQIKLKDTPIELNSTGTSWTQSGERYSIRKGEFHQSIVPNNTFAASIVRTSNTAFRTNPLVVGKAGFCKHYNYKERIVVTSEFLEYVSQLTSS